MAAASSRYNTTSPSFSPTQNNCKWTYHVFLSFRGEDTRKHFTGHLYSGLRRSGLRVFKDDEKLERGKEIVPELLKAIEQSMFSVIVLSKNYASSSWCLEELAKIIECGDQKGQKIFPVFYDVDPSDVRKQTGSFQDDFSKHEEKYRENMDKVRKWRAAMTQVANLSGWTSQNRNESEIIEEIVQKIDYELSQTFSSVSEDLVGIDSRVRVVSDMLFGGQNDVRIIGISGMGGIGKSTIARAVYDKIRSDFEGSCFLANVREGFEKQGAVPLQKQLLSEILREKSPKIWDPEKGITEIKNRLQNRKVLVILDDVDTLKQLHFLAVDWKWFLPGSRLIITSRDKNLLSTHAVDGIYEAEELNDDDALVLLSRKAFKQDQPIEGFWELCKSVLGHARGLPLAARVLGSSLCGRSMDFWESFIKRLNEIPNRDVMDVLKISFDGLEELEKKLFLDLACFFEGMNKDQVKRILNQCGFHANYGIQILQDKSLIWVSNNTLSMHDLLQAMGREVVRQESTAEPGRRSRLWASKDVFHVLRKNTGTEEIESIALDWANPEEVEGTMQKTKWSAWNTGVFSKMSRLRLLRIRNACFDSGPEYLSNELRFLEWRNYPSKSLPSSFQPENLVEVHLCYSNLRQLWHGNKILDSLKVIDLSYSEYLTKTPDFTGIPNLERLILEGCRRLSQVHSSIGHHNKLIYVNLIDCKSLTSLPSRISGLNLLEELHLSGCSKLKEFPEIKGNKKCLRKLCLDQTSIEELPLSIQYLVGLISLSLKDCKKLSRLPISINGLKSLKTLHLSGCSELENLPENLGQLECLNELDVSGTAIREPPVSIFSLTNLKILSFHGCAESSRSTTNIWQRLMFPLMPRKRATSTSLVLPSLSGLSSLTKLDLRNCNLGEGAVPNDIGYLSSLRHLDLSCNKFVSLPTSIDQLSGLQFLRMEDCKMLQSLPQLPPNLQLFSVNGCTSLEKMQFSSNLCKFNYPSFSFINCWRLSESDCWNNMLHTLLRKCFQGPPNLINSFSVVIPGSEIPTWFSHQSEGSSVSVQTPPHSLENDEWLGYVVCASLEYDGCASSEICANIPYWVFGVPMHCFFNGYRCRNMMSVFPSSIEMKWNWDNISSDHLWYLFFPSRFKIFDRHISLRFATCRPQIKVIKCGVRLVYHQDIEGLNRMTNLYENSTFEGVDECFQESGGSTMRGGSALVKRLGHTNDVGEASGIVSSDEQPPTKKLKQI